ncbi:MAG: peptidase dimerization domain-containing protein [Oscillospiraceae bacterium]
MGEPHYDNLVIGATGKALLSLRVQGKEGHASTPERGVNAIDCMATLLCAMQKKIYASI